MKEIVINRMYAGSYLANNLGHEVINMFQADNGKHYLYLNPRGNILRNNVDCMLLVRYVGDDRVEILALAKNLKQAAGASSSLPRDLGEKKESVSHTHCIETTRIIQECIKSNGYDEGDYTITVSSAGFRWKFDSRYELFEDMPIKIKYRNGEDFVTTYAVLKEAKDDYIVISVIDEENITNEKNIKILKNDIIKARLNC